MKNLGLYNFRFQFPFFVLPYSSYTLLSMSQTKKVFITGANSGIGLALAKQLAAMDFHVFLGSRNEERGREAVASITSSGKVDLVVIDESSDASVKAAAASIASHAPFDVIVNNAGTGLGHGATLDDVLNVNIFGAKRVIDTFLPMLAPDGRLVGTSSGGASGYVSGKIFGQPAGTLSVEERKAVFANFDVTWDQIDAAIQKEKAANYGVEEEQLQGMCVYGLSKAALTSYHMILARENPSLVVSTCSPGFINTKMTAGYGASLEPEDGTVSLKKCILDDLGECKGWYYGSDGLRSPLTYMRNPGEPEYKPEEEESK